MNDTKHTLTDWTCSFTPQHRVPNYRRIKAARRAANRRAGQHPPLKSAKETPKNTVTSDSAVGCDVFQNSGKIENRGFDE